MTNRALLLTVFCTSLLASSAQAESFIRQDLDFCQRNAQSVICTEYNQPSSDIVDRSQSNVDPFLSQVERMNMRVVSRFRPQKESVDVWNVFTSLIDTANRNSIVADCEDVAMTAIEYMVARGIPANRFARAIVLAYPQANIGDLETTEVHLVGVYHSLETNRMYYIGDSYRSSLETIRSSLHEPMHINWLTDGRHWLQWSN